jgi:hypothetical protein
MKRSMVGDVPLSLADEDSRQMRFVFDRRPAVLVGAASFILWGAFLVVQLRTRDSDLALLICGAGAFFSLLLIGQYLRRQAELVIDKVSGSAAYANRIGASCVEWRKSSAALRHLLARPAEDRGIVMDLVPAEGERVRLELGAFKWNTDKRSRDLLARTAAALRLPVYVATHALRQTLEEVPGLRVEVRPELF